MFISLISEKIGQKKENKSRWRYKQEGVDAVEDSAVAGYEMARILYAVCSLDE